MRVESREGVIVKQTTTPAGESRDTSEGGGRGRMGGEEAGGPGGVCVCQECGYEEPHEDPGEPCYTKKCPECATALTRKAETDAEKRAHEEGVQEGIHIAQDKFDELSKQVRGGGDPRGITGWFTDPSGQRRPRTQRLPAGRERTTPEFEAEARDSMARVDLIQLGLELMDAGWTPTDLAAQFDFAFEDHDGKLALTKDAKEGRIHITLNAGERERLASEGPGGPPEEEAETEEE